MSSCCRGQNRPMHKQDGPWSWLVLGCAFFQSWIMFGQMRAFGIFLPILMAEFNAGRDKVALMQSAILSGSLFLTMIGTWLNTIFLNRTVCFVGQLFIVAAFGISSFVRKLELMYFTYSILNAFGLALTSASHVLIIFKYFRRHRSLAQGMNVSGGAIGMMTIPIVMQYLIDNVGWRNAFRVAAGVVGFFSFLCIVYSPNIKIDLPGIDDKSPPKDKSPENKDDSTDLQTNPKTAEDISGCYDNYNCTDVKDNHKIAKSINVQLETIADGKHPTSKNQTDGHAGVPVTAEQENQDDIQQNGCENVIADQPIVSLDQKNPTLDSDNSICTGGQKNSPSELSNHQFTTGHDNPSFAHDNQQPTADHEHLSYEHDSDQEGKQSNHEETDKEKKENGVINNTSENVVDQPKSTKCLGLLDCSVWKKSKFVFAVIALAMSIFALFSPSTHLIKFSEDGVGLTPTKAATLYTFVGISSLIGRIGAGKICDISWVDPFIVDIVALLMASLGTFLFTFSKTYIHLAVASTIFGLSDGISRTLFVIILTNCVEPSKVTVAYGQAASAMAPFGLGGPAITGLLADKLGGYNIAYYMNGCILIGSAAILLIPTIQKHCKKSRDYTLDHVTMAAVRENNNSA